MRSTICLAEDRVACEPALKIALLSLNKHCPEQEINLFYPAANLEFVHWIRRCPQARLQTNPLKTGYGWNIKPQAILRLIDEGFDEVLWLDSDILVKRNTAHIFAALKSDTLAVAEDALGDERDDPDALRARRWGLRVGRVLPFGLNSGVLRVTRDHRRLMERWWELLQSETYQEVQTRPWEQRPLHMLGDQDVLTALLSSQEFWEIPLYILRRGKDIIQYNGVYGYTVAERALGLVGNAVTFIHQFGHKPWSDGWHPSSLRDYTKKLYLDLSPHTVGALQFRRELECDTEWMNPHFGASRVLRALGMGSPELTGLPVAAIMEVARLAKYIRRSGRLKHSVSEPDATEMRVNADTPASTSKSAGF
jgi:hypothetical protein